MYDGDNKVVGRSKPNKLKLRRGELFFTTWVLPLAGLAPDVYRIDCLVDGAPGGILAPCSHAVVPRCC